MNSLVLRSLTASCITLLLACGGGGGGGSTSTATPAPEPDFQATTLQEALDHGIGQGVDGFILHINYADGSTESFAAGIQDRGNSTPMDPAALFKIASVSKLFIASAATQLHHQGILSLDDTLATWLPAIASRVQNAQSISLRHMLQHRSGIPDFDSQSGFSWQNSHSDIDQVLAYALDVPADFAPNARYEYSNTNYLLAAKILDEALGYSHRQHIQDFILDPLGMLDTYQEFEDANSELLVRGYWDGADKTLLQYAVPGGSMISTASDVAVFLRALATGGLLSGEEQSTYANVYFYDHSGWLPGYQSIANYEQSIDAAVVLFLNNTGGNSEAVLVDTYQDIIGVLRQ